MIHQASGWQATRLYYLEFAQSHRSITRERNLNPIMGSQFPECCLSNFSTRFLLNRFDSEWLLSSFIIFLDAQFHFMNKRSRIHRLIELRFSIHRREICVSYWHTRDETINAFNIICFERVTGSSLWKGEA